MYIQIQLGLRAATLAAALVWAIRFYQYYYYKIFYLKFVLESVEVIFEA